MIRRLTEGEIALARSVFADAIDYGQVRVLVRRSGRWAVVLGPVMTFPPSCPPDFSAEPPRIQAWLIHELTHVWQFQTRPFWTIGSWARTLLGGGYGPGLPGYRYGFPLRWAALNLEQQASVVEHAFVLRETGRGPTPGARWSDYKGCGPLL